MTGNRRRRFLRVFLRLWPGIILLFFFNNCSNDFKSLEQIQSDASSVSPISGALPDSINSGTSGSASPTSSSDGSNTSTGGSSPASSGGSGSSTTSVSIYTPSPDPQGVPKFVAGMKLFEVRDMTGDYAPANGYETMFSALPKEWQLLGQPSGANGVFNAWSGGVGDSAGRRLFIHGGGHGDSSNNGLYYYDFQGDERPAGWKIAPNSLSAKSAVLPSVSAYSDDYPISVHSYDQMYYDSKLKRFYRFGGSRYGDGSCSQTAVYYDFISNQWVNWFATAKLNADLGAVLFGSDDGSKLLYLGGIKQPFFVDVATGSLLNSGDSPFHTTEAGAIKVYDSKRSRWVVFDKFGALSVEVNWSKNSFVTHSESLTGPNAADLVSQAPCALYDETRDSFWILAPRSAGGKIQYIYEVNANNFAVTRSDLSKTIDSYDNTTGTYNKCVIFNDWRTIGIVLRHDRPMSLIRLP